MTVDTAEMVFVHKAFRREFALLAMVVRDVRPDDAARRRVVSEHARDLVGYLHHHHEGEDALLWPLLMDRAPLERSLVVRMERQHEQLSARLDELPGLLEAWSRDGDGARLAEVAAATSEALDEHLHDEEVLVLPLAAEHVTQAEWDALGERGRASMPKGRKALLFLGALLEDASEAERAHFMTVLPRPVRLLWRTVGVRAYAAQVRAVRGSVLEPVASR